MLDEDVKPQQPELRTDGAAPGRVVATNRYDRLVPPSQRLINVAEALHSASKRLGMFGN